MKKHISVFMLMARSTIYKIVSLFAILAMIEGALFWKTLNNELVLYGDGQGLKGLETIIAESGVPFACIAGLLLTALFLSLTGCEFGSKQGYTLGRLSISYE